MFVFSDDKERDQMTSVAKQYIKQTCLAIDTKTTKTNKNVSNNQHNQHNQQPPSKRAKVTHSNFDFHFSEEEDELESGQSPSVLDEIISEINSYFNIKFTVEEKNALLANSNSINTLTFFRNKQAVFPHLTSLVKKLICITASSVPSESLFSKAGQITTERRNRLKPTLVESLIFLKENLIFLK